MKYAARPSNRVLKGKRTSEDLTGRRFDSLVVVRIGGYSANQFWWCRCDCGNEVLRSTRALVGGKKRGSVSGCDSCSKFVHKGEPIAPRRVIRQRCSHGFAEPEKDCLKCRAHIAGTSASSEEKGAA